MTDWYRNTNWNEEVAASFEAKLAKARSQKAQYLYIQGQALALIDPDVALGLLNRCISEGEEAHIAPSHFQAAYAYLAKDDIDRALDSLIAAMEQQVRAPWMQTGAAMDYAFLAAYWSRKDHYPAARPILEAFRNSPFAELDLQGLAAVALINSDEGNDQIAAKAARQALELAPCPDDFAEGPFLGRFSYPDLVERLKDIAR